MRKNLIEVFNAWSKGQTIRRADSIHTNGETIFSYNTAILRRGTPTVLNVSQYSATTTRQQNSLKVLLKQSGIEYREIDGIYRGTQSLP